MTLSIATPAGIGRRQALHALLLPALLQAGCSRPEPWRIGFLSDMSQRTSQAGQDARNAALLAVEEANAGGGIDGRSIELVARDSGSDAASARTGAQVLLDGKVDAIVAATVSAAIVAMLPLVNAAHVPMVGPMASSTELTGRDDYLIRTGPSTRDSALAYARELARRGQHRIAAVFDERNASLSEFRPAFAAQGRQLVAMAGFGVTVAWNPEVLVGNLLAAGPDGMLFVTSAFEAAHLAHQARRLAPRLPLYATGWASSSTLIEIGGQAVEGLLVAQTYYPSDPSPRYQDFRQRFLKRFDAEPGYAAAASYDGTSVLLQAMRLRQRDETLWDALLRRGPYEGLQKPIVLDRFGDARPAVHFTEVRKGRFAYIATDAPARGSPAADPAARRR